MATTGFVGALTVEHEVLTAAVGQADEVAER